MLRHEDSDDDRRSSSHCARSEAKTSSDSEEDDRKIAPSEGQQESDEQENPRKKTKRETTRQTAAVPAPRAHVEHPSPSAGFPMQVDPTSFALSSPPGLQSDYQRLLQILNPTREESQMSIEAILARAQANPIPQLPFAAASAATRAPAFHPTLPLHAVPTLPLHARSPFGLHMTQPQPVRQSAVDLALQLGGLNRLTASVGRPELDLTSLALRPQIELQLDRHLLSASALREQYLRALLREQAATAAAQSALAWLRGLQHHSTGGIPASVVGQLHSAVPSQPERREMHNVAAHPSTQHLSLPAVLLQPEDELKLSSHQVLLRKQIEAFEASEDDVSTHTRGRNKPISLGQIGLRCRHCSHLPVSRRQRGSTYFPASLMGLYQAAQNMSVTHLQCGLCTEMPEDLKQQFAQVQSAKVKGSVAGRPYWAQSARKLGLVDTEGDGIRFINHLPPGARVVGITDR